MKNMILTQKKDKKLARDFWIKLKDYANVSKQCVQLENTVNSFQKPTKFYTKKDPYVTWQKF